MSTSSIPQPPSTPPVTSPSKPQAPRDIPSPPEPATAPQKEDRDDDHLVNVAGAAAVADIVDDVMDDGVDDGDGNFTQFIMGLSAAGIVLSYLATINNPGNTGVLIGIGVFLIGYLILLSGLFVFYLIAGALACLYINLFDDGNIPYLFIFGALGIGGLLKWLLSQIPGRVLRTLRFVSWVAMFAGPFIMIQSGANITGTLCIIVSVIWLIFFIIGMTVSFASKKVENAIDSAIDKRLAAGKKAISTPDGTASMSKTQPATPDLHQKPAEASSASTTE